MATTGKPRVIVCTDISSLIGGWREPDDTQSLVRLLLYANDLDLEGLIATHTVHGSVHPEFIEAIVHAYGHVQANLRLHDASYPTRDELLGLIKAGSAAAGVEHLDDRGDTDGSNWIISVVDKPDPRPVWVLLWGGPNELAQALWRVERERGADGLKAFVDKLRVYAIADQDNTGPWIKEKHPSLFYITSTLAFRGMYLGGDTSLTSWDWVHTNVRPIGPLGAAYPNYWGGDCFGGPPGRVRGVKEGDTPSFLYLIPTGLSDPMHPEWGGWGGRFVRSGVGNQYDDGQEVLEGEPSRKASVYRWRPAFQADFLARLDWTIKPTSRANHPPSVRVGGGTRRTVAPGDTITLDASGTADPDGDHLTFRWQRDPNADTFDGHVPLGGSAAAVCTLVAPDVPDKRTIHIILTVTDDGTPPLSRYQRVVLTVDPKARRH